MSGISSETESRASSSYDLSADIELEKEPQHEQRKWSGEYSSSDSAEDELLKDPRVLEAQQAVQPPNEHTTSTRSKLIFLGAWFFLNLALTISNKAVLQKARFPWLLTCLHTSATSFGCFAMIPFGTLKLTRLTTKENMMLAAFSVLFTVNIAISNVSLAVVSVPFHQIMRSTCPVVTVIIYRTWYKRTYSTPTYLSLIPVILGVGLATAGDYYCTLAGFLLTLLGVVLASVKTVATNRMMTGSLALGPMELLLRMSPLAAIQCLVYAFLSGETSSAYEAFSEGEFSASFGAALVANAAIAFALNIVSFQANKMAGALTMTVAGNVKQTLTILLGIVLFNVQTGLVNGVGMTITVAGAAWYSKVELDNKRARSKS